MLQYMVSHALRYDEIMLSDVLRYSEIYSYSCI